MTILLLFIYLPAKLPESEEVDREKEVSLLSQRSSTCSIAEILPTESSVSSTSYKPPNVPLCCSQSPFSTTLTDSKGKQMSSSAAQDPYEQDASSTPMYNQNCGSYGSYQPSCMLRCGDIFRKSVADANALDEPNYSINRFSNSHRDDPTGEFLYTQSQLGRVEGSRNRRDRANDTLQVISNPETDDRNDWGHRGSLTVENLPTQRVRYPTDLELEQGSTDHYGGSMTGYNFEPVNQLGTNTINYFGTNGTPREEDLDRDEKRRRREKKHRKESRRNEEKRYSEGDRHRERLQSLPDSRAPHYMGHDSCDNNQGQQIYSSHSGR